MSTLRLFLISLAVILPTSAFALEGIGPRVTVLGTVTAVHLTEKQAFDQEGGEVIVTATNGQTVTIVITKETQLTSEGRLSRKLLIPANITPGMQVRVRGVRIDSQSLTASLFIIMNIELSPALSYSGTLQSVGENSVTILSPDGKSRTFTITNETEISFSYTVYGSRGLTLIGKKIQLTLNPADNTKVRILRITGDADPVPSAKPKNSR